jgi:ubiquinone/menaquinone biosynthesis C-methylase UbiE
MQSPAKHFVPAAGHHWLLPLYDPFCRLVGAERLRERLIDTAEIRAEQRVLDLGCGTGALSLAIKRRHPQVRVVGVDPDPKALARAREKAARAGHELTFDEAFGGELPYAEGSFDRVLSSLMLHHLTRDEKLGALREVRRVLAPGGAFYVLDLGPPRNALERGLTRLFHRGERLGDNVAGRIPALAREAGFLDAHEIARLPTLFGSVTLLVASDANPSLAGDPS